MRSNRIRMRMTWIGVMACLVVALELSAVHAAPKAELWPLWQKHDPASSRKINHDAWQAFLKKYVVVNTSGINRVRYTAVSRGDRISLMNYLRSLEATAISEHNRNEQRAYWINLYNAKTVELILSRLPVKSIRDINISPGLFSSGPWGAKLLTVEGEKLSLDDIEHRILRPIWQDNRIHYAVNCASLGCPNLQPIAFTADNTEAQLEKGAREFINHRRGVSIDGEKLKVSSIYIWFQEDFGGSAEGLMQHWQKYAAGPLAQALQTYSGGLSHGYDWRLNDVSDKPSGS